MITKVHDSHACTLDNGGPCVMCRFANERELRDDTFHALTESFVAEAAFPVESPRLRSLIEAQAYREGYAAGWTDAHAARLQAENEALREDLREMGRLATTHKDDRRALED